MLIFQSGSRPSSLSGPSLFKTKGRLWTWEHRLLHNMHVHWLPVFAATLAHRKNMRLTTVTPWILKCDPVIFQVDSRNKDVMPW